MIRRSFRFSAVLLLLAAGLASVTQAQSPATAPGAAVQQPLPVLDPYEGRVPVPDQSADHREAGLRAALSQVLQRLSGELPPGSDAIVARASQLVQRYGYEVDPQTRQLQLVAAFDRRAVEGQLRALGGTAIQPDEEVRLSVSGVNDAQDYVRVIRTLKALPGVSRVNVDAASGDRLDLRLRAQGGAGRVSGALFVGGALAPETPVPGFELAYRLR
jgi:hypothetical protein